MKIAAIGLVLCASASAWASDIINQDTKSYSVSVTDGGYTAKYKVRGGGSQYGVCASGPCTFKIPGSSVVAPKDGRVVIKNGKISKQ